MKGKESVEKLLEVLDKVMDYDVEIHNSKNYNSGYRKFAFFWKGFDSNLEYKNELLEILRSIKSPAFDTQIKLLIFIMKIIRIIEEKDNKIQNLQWYIEELNANLNGISLNHYENEKGEKSYADAYNTYADEVKFELEKIIEKIKPKGKSANKKYRALAYCWRAFEEVEKDFSNKKIIDFMGKPYNQSSFSQWKKKKENMGKFLQWQKETSSEIISRLKPEIRKYLSNHPYSVYSIKNRIEGFTELLPLPKIK